MVHSKRPNTPKKKKKEEDEEIFHRLVEGFQSVVVFPEQLQYLIIAELVCKSLFLIPM